VKKHTMNSLPGSVTFAGDAGAIQAEEYPARPAMYQDPAMIHPV
jgi:hypothetical protein